MFNSSKMYFDMPQSFIETLEQSFDMLNPYQKAKFIGERLDWATNADLGEHFKKRLSNPSKFRDNA